VGQRAQDLEVYRKSHPVAGLLARQGAVVAIQALESGTLEDANEAAQRWIGELRAAGCA
jgi:hypothetical protein